MGIEKWIAATSIGLFLMFAGEMISIYLFMTQVPPDIEAIQFEPDPKIFQFISIGIAPAGILAGLSYLMSRRYGSKPVGFLIISAGVVLLIGMAYCYTIVDRIEAKYVTDTVSYAPIVFMALSAPVIAFGSILLKTKKKRPKKEYF